MAPPRRLCYLARFPKPGLQQLSMSDFGADIFDQDSPQPPAPPTKAAGKRKGTRKTKATEPAADAATPPDAEAATTGEPATAAREPAAGPSRRTRRRHPAQADSSEAPANPTSEVPEAPEAEAHATSDAPKKRRRRRNSAADVETPPPAERPTEVAEQVLPPPLQRASAPRAESAAMAPHLRRWTQRHGGGHAEDGDERRRRVAVLLDLHHLQEDARSRGAELSFRKILRNIAGERRVLRAVCYLLKEAPRPAAAAIAASGFEVHVLDDDRGIRARMQVDADAMPAGIETVVLCPGTDDQLALGERLAANGMEIETAGFEPTGGIGHRHRQLGRECVFVP